MVWPQLRLYDRSRDEDGTIRRKRSDALVETLRKEYGDGFAPGVRFDMMFGTLLDLTGMPSLGAYVRAGMPEVPNRS